MKKLLILSILLTLTCNLPEITFTPKLVTTMRVINPANGNEITEKSTFGPNDTLNLAWVVSNTNSAEDASNCTMIVESNTEWLDLEFAGVQDATPPCLASPTTNSTRHKLHFNSLNILRGDECIGNIRIIGTPSNTDLIGDAGQISITLQCGNLRFPEAQSKSIRYWNREVCDDGIDNDAAADAYIQSSLGLDQNNFTTCKDSIDADCGGKEMYNLSITDTISIDWNQCNPDADKKDNDCDGLINGMDPDCDSTGFETKNEPDKVWTCNDSKDNDRDGCFDKYDSGCGGTEAYTGAQKDWGRCHDGIDNDCDNKFDCDDNDDFDCKAQPQICPTREICTSGIQGRPWEEQDGCAKCLSDSINIGGSGKEYQDSSSIDAACNNNDDIDNDCDGRVDCLDPDCWGYCNANYRDPISLFGDGPENSCSDNRDNDLDGLIDCGDPDCFGQVQCTTENITYQQYIYGVYRYPQRNLCLDGADNDNDGLADYFDPDCWPIGK